MLLLSGMAWPALLGGTAWLLMAIAYASLVRFYRLHVVWALTLPLAALFYELATIYSAINYWRGAGGSWKGRHQDLDTAHTIS
jgi:hypothetical protein